MSSKTFNDIYSEHKKISDKGLDKFKQFGKELRKELANSSYEAKEIVKFHEMYSDDIPEIHLDSSYRMSWDTTLILSLKSEYLIFDYTIRLPSHGDTIEICRQKIDEFDLSAKDFVEMLPSIVEDIRNNRM